MTSLQSFVPSVIALAFGAIGTLGFMVYAGEPESLTWWLLFLPFAAWGFLPYFLLALVARQGRPAGGSQYVLLISAMLLTGFSMKILYSAFIVDVDAQSGIVFIFLPIWQLVGLIPFVLTAKLLERRGSTAV